MTFPIIPPRQGQNDRRKAVQGRPVNGRQNMMIHFFSDLDNTLIYSHRAAPEADKVLAEMLDGREQSYMTRRTLTFLQNAPWLRLIPVTTRSKEQFARISLFPAYLPCPYALVCNGGELLVNGESDPQWLEETRALIAPAADALREGIARMESMIGGGRIIRNPSGLMACGVFEDPAGTVQKLRDAIDDPAVSILRAGRKVYCIPAAMDKGAAVERFKARYPTGAIAAAGDSVLDIPLLEKGEIAITNRALASAVRNPHTVAIDDHLILSDEICSVLADFSITSK